MPQWKCKGCGAVQDDTGRATFTEEQLEEQERHEQQHTPGVGAQGAQPAEVQEPGFEGYMLWPQLAE